MPTDVVTVEADELALLDPELRAVPPQLGPRCRHAAGAHSPALSIRETVAHDEAPVFIASALRDIRAYMQEHRVGPGGPPFARSRPGAGGTLDVEVGWPVERPFAGTSRIHCCELPSPGHRLS